MQPGDKPNSTDPAYDTPLLQTTLFPLPQSRPLPIREFLTTDQPRNRLMQHGAAALSDAELLAVITGVPCLETAQRLLIAAGGLRGLLAISTAELQQLVAGISVSRAAQLKAAIELGTRVVYVVFRPAGAKNDVHEHRERDNPWSPIWHETGGCGRFATWLESYSALGHFCSQAQPWRRWCCCLAPTYSSMASSRWLVPI
jgi:hypothetical protein